jgi:hypothetical protein
MLVTMAAQFLQEKRGVVGQKVKKPEYYQRNTAGTSRGLEGESYWSPAHIDGWASVFHRRQKFGSLLPAVLLSLRMMEVLVASLSC